MASVVIKPGDTLSGIAGTQGTTINDLLKANPNISDPNLIIAGQSLNLPEAAPAAPVPATPAAPAPVPDVKIDDTLPAELGTQKEAAIQTPQMGTIDTTDAFVESLTPTQQSIQDIFTQAGQQTQPFEQERSTLTERLTQSLEQLTGRGARQAEVEQQLGVTADVDRLKQLNQQIAQTRAEFDKLVVGEEGQGRGITAGLVGGAQAKLRRQQAVELGGLSAVAQALQGNIDLARQTSQRTVDLEFEPVEQEIANIRLLLDVNEQNLSTAEKRRAEQLKVQLTERQAQIDQQKADKSEAKQLALQAAQAGASQDIVSQMFNANNAQEAIGIGGEFLAQQGKRDTQLVEVGGVTQLIDIQTGEVIREIGSTLTPFELQKQNLQLEQLQLDNMKTAQEAGLAPISQAGSNANLSTFMDALMGQESGGDANAVNARTGASGLFQIMPGNWGSWAQEAGLASDATQTPENQRLVAAFKLDQYFNKYGNWADVASVWYSGRPLSQVIKEGWADKPQGPTGAEPSVRQYVNQVLSRLPQEQKKVVTPKEARSINQEITKNDAFKAITTADSTLAKLKNYREIFDEVGNQRFGKDAQRLRTAYRATLLDLKDYFNLGVLNGPDLELMESLLVNPNINSITNPIRFREIGGEKGIEASIDEMEKMIREHAEARYNDLQTAYMDYDPNQVTNLLNAENTINELIGQANQ